MFSKGSHSSGNGAGYSYQSSNGHGTEDDDAESGNLKHKYSSRKYVHGIAALKEKAKAGFKRDRPMSIQFEEKEVVPLHDPPQPIAELEGDDQVITSACTSGPLPLPPFEVDDNSKIPGGVYPVFVYNEKAGGLTRQTPNEQSTRERGLRSSFGSNLADTGATSSRDHKISKNDSTGMEVQRRAVESSRHHDEQHSPPKAPSSEGIERLQFAEIEKAFLRAVIKYPELKGYEDASAEKMITRFLDFYERLTAPMRDDQGRLDPTPRNKREISKLENKIYRLESDLREKENKLSQYKADYKDLASHYDRDMEQLKRDIASLKFQKKESESAHGTRLKKEQKSLRDENDRLKSMFEGQLRKARDDALSASRDAKDRQERASKKIDSLNAQLLSDNTQWSQSYKHLENIKAELERRLNSAKADEEARVVEVEDTWERKLEREQDRHEDQVRILKAEIERMVAAVDRERSHKQEELQQQKEDLTRKYEERYKDLNTVIEEFKVGAAKREHFKGLTDSEIAALFKRLANAIEDFRLDWDPTREDKWPFSETRLRQLHPENIRKLKQAIIQNTLWVLLYEHVFRSPFKIFGTDGRAYDEPWTGIYSLGDSPHEWDDVPPEVEKSRYENAKAFMDAVDSSNNNVGYKHSFEDSVSTAVNAMSRALEKVASLKTRHHKSLENIVRLAARTWLESCTQRFRVIVIASHGSGDILSYMSSDISSLKLIIRPDLKRYGDSQGKDLMRGAPLAGWKGSMEAYPQ